MSKQWKVGELAELTGLSIRTLRYYDQIGLFPPSEYTDAGHRRYTHHDLQKLHEILVLKQMGLSLENIQELIKRDENQSVMDVIEKQIHRVRSEIELQKQLLSHLETTKSGLSHKKTVSIKELIALFELMKVHRSKYFTDAQLDELRAYYKQVGKDVMSKLEIEFTRLLIQLREKKEEGVSPKNQAVQELAKKWNEMAYSALDGNAELIRSAEAFYAENPDVAFSQGVEADLYAYIQEALKIE